MRNVSEYLTKQYLQGETLMHIRTQLTKKKSMHLKSFFQTKKMTAILQSISKTKTKGKYVPNQYKYSYLSPSAKLQKNIQSFFSFLLSETFIRYVSFISGKKLSLASLCVKVYRKGDYKVIHDTSIKSRVRIVIDLTKQWKEHYGGMIGIHEGNEFITIPLKKNDLSIVLCTKNTKDFVLYVKHFAKQKRVFVELSFS